MTRNSCTDRAGQASSASPFSQADRPFFARFALRRYDTFSTGVQRKWTRSVAGFLTGGLPLPRLGSSMPGLYVRTNILTRGSGSPIICAYT